MQVIFNELTIKNFRQIAERSIKFDPKLNVIKGRNGSGKTNTLHAITWLLFGKDLYDRTKFQAVPLNPDNTVTELDPDVELSMTINGEPHTLRRTLKGGKTAQTYINDMPCKTLKEFDTFVSDVFQTPDRFKVYTNPLHFPGMHWQEQRSLFMQFFPEPPPAAVLRRVEDRQDYILSLKETLLKGQPERLADKLTQDKKDLDAERDKIRHQVELLDEQLEGQQAMDVQALTVERHELREKVRSMRDVIKTATDHNSKIERERMRLTSRREHLLSEIEDIKRRTSDGRKHEIAQRTRQISQLEAERSALKDAYIQTETEGKNCVTCGQPLPADAIDGLKTSIADKGRAVAEQIREATEVMDVLKNRPLDLPDIGEMANEAQLCVNDMQRLGDLVDIPTLDNDMLDRLDTLDRALARADVHKENMERRTALKDREREINRLYEETETGLREVADYMFYRSELIVEAVNQEFKSISVKVLDIQKNGIAKETFEIMMNGVPYAELNTAGQLEAGLELVGFIKERLDVTCPVLIDNGERFTDLNLKKIKGQLIVTKAVKAAELSVVYTI